MSPNKREKFNALVERTMTPDQQKRMRKEARELESAHRLHDAMLEETVVPIVKELFGKAQADPKPLREPYLEHLNEVPLRTRLEGAWEHKTFPECSDKRYQHAYDVQQRRQDR